MLAGCGCVGGGVVITCDKCNQPANMTWMCRKCDADTCERCMGDYDYDTEHGSVVVCKDCVQPKAAA